jgi:hypothetical protein
LLRLQKIREPEEQHLPQLKIAVPQIQQMLSEEEGPAYEIKRAGNWDYKRSAFQQRSQIHNPLDQQYKLEPDNLNQAAILDAAISVSGTAAKRVYFLPAAGRARKSLFIVQMCGPFPE